MARAVADVLDDGGVLLAEAGTGTGKTLAYLVPAILSGQRVLVSTGTKNLQEQIYFKDLPVLRAGARRAVHRHLHEGPRQLPVPAPARSAARAAASPAGADSTRSPRGRATTETGDRAELEDLPEDIAAVARHLGHRRDLPRQRLPAVSASASSRACASAPPSPTS